MTTFAKNLSALQAHQLGIQSLDREYRDAMVEISASIRRHMGVVDVATDYERSELCVRNMAEVASDLHDTMTVLVDDAKELLEKLHASEKECVDGSA